MGTIRVILLIIHIISAGSWLSTEFIGFVMSRLIGKNKGKPEELTLAKATVTLISAIAPLCSMGILLTGIGMTLNNGWVLFGINGFTPAWLFVKQVVYTLLFIFVMVYIRPNGERLEKEFVAATAQGTMTDEARALMRSAWILGSIDSLMVFINIVLAVWKPSIG